MHKLRVAILGGESERECNGEEMTERPARVRQVIQRVMGECETRRMDLVSNTSEASHQRTSVISVL